MPLFYSLSKSDQGFECLFTEMPKPKAQVHANQSLIDEDKGESSDLAASKSKYELLPDYLRSCLDYSCIVSTLCNLMRKKNLIRLLIAENLIPEKSGEILEDTASNIIDELVVLGMIEKIFNCYGDEIVVSEMYKKTCLFKVEQDFVNEAKNSPIYAAIQRKHDLPELPLDNLKNFSIRSLFVCGTVYGAFFKTICTYQFIVVLDLCWVIYLPDEVGDLVNLRYLGLHGQKLKELPNSIGYLQKLQTLDISYSNIKQLPVEILNIKQLRHLLLNKSVSVPKGIENLVNLHTWDGVCCIPRIISELSKLTQLRELTVCASGDYAEELLAAIMKMENLIFLSLTAERIYGVTDEIIYLLPDLESFCPPPHLQGLHLRGGLVEIPTWLSTMENLTNLNLSASNLHQNLSSGLQFIPKLKRLALCGACNARCIGKEFCDAGGFPLLECLVIHSKNLVEWTEIVDGAFPSLKYLEFRCSRLMFLPEGLQYIATMEEIRFNSLHSDLLRRLKGKENYKIKHIPKVIGLEER